MIYVVDPLITDIIGANIAADCTVAQEALNKTGFSFLFSQKFHPTMKSVAQIRRELGVRTIFNILGPLVNPARPAYIVAGTDPIPPHSINNICNIFLSSKLVYWLFWLLQVH